ncbi:tyrosine--tRNA ligase [Telmatocola sphagniphila]|uniref:Tyrosine--tRNA ligase n=1 Tax=Telmatocola sphagniphila TaxID=1123043 RepID=A0A8E6EYY6_9BACT|nr:tyrosine--tRNA ligase [Telmatocola sphagniphila]QVL32846.1 tyrosine--tRNA ligase [Telmatocola sphagniphila]
MLSIDQQLEHLRRGTEQIEPAGELRKKLEKSQATGKPLRVKYGIDPTGIDVHLGHTVPLRKLRLFQELGHQAVLIIGNYTALVGDPSGRDQSRARLTEEQVEKNAIDYLKQVAKVIDIQKAEVRRNGEWFSKFSFLDVLSLTSKTTIQRMLERDDFTKRFRAEPSVPIYMHECLYPLMQGHDSVEIHADIELGGSEQLFNLMMGRRLQEIDGQEPQICMTMPILRGLDGNRRMGKSLGNYVGIGEPANEQFGKTMSIPDSLLKEWFELLTDRPAAEIEALISSHPMAAKKTLGKDIVSFYHGAEAAEAAQKEWENRFSKGQDPAEIPEAIVATTDLFEGKINIAKLVAVCGLAKSNSEARQKVTEGAVNVGADRTKITDPKQMIVPEDGMIIRLGSRGIRRLKVQ